jgi:heat shock protein HtpX
VKLTAKSIFRASNVGTIVFFVLNTALITGILSLVTPYFVLIGIILYVATVLLMFSQLGDGILCFMVGAKKMTRADMKVRMRPLLEIAYKKAMRKTPGLSNQLRLKVCYTPEPNAYAIGRRTICVTEGLFQLPDDAIQGILAHEVAHLALRHSHIQLLIGGGNFVMTILILVSRLICSLIGFVTLGSAYAEFRRNGMNGCLAVLPGLFVSGIVWLWTKLCVSLLMWSSRKNEFEADAYAAELGYGCELAMALEAIGTSEPRESFFKALYSTHPNTHERIGRLQKLSGGYSRH